LGNPALRQPLLVRKCPELPCPTGEERISSAHGGQAGFPTHHTASWKRQLELNGLSQNATVPFPDASFIQVPFNISPLHSFTIYSVIFFVESNAAEHLAYVLIKTTTASGEQVAVKIGVEKVRSNGSTIQRLAAKAAIQDFEGGKSFYRIRRKMRNRCVYYLG